MKRQRHWKFAQPTDKVRVGPGPAGPQVGGHHLVEGLVQDPLHLGLQSRKNELAEEILSKVAAAA